MIRLWILAYMAAHLYSSGLSEHGLLGFDLSKSIFYITADFCCNEEEEDFKSLQFPVSPAESIGDLPERAPTPSNWKMLPEHVVYFQYNTAELTDQAKAAIEKNVKFLKQNPDYHVLIEGHCDERGTPEYNLVLGGVRADKVKSYMMELGIERERIITKAWGEELPTRLDHSEEAWAENRRVEMYYSKL